MKVKALLVTSMKYNCIFVCYINVVDISSYNVPFVVYLIFGFLPVQNKTLVQLLSFFHTEEKNTIYLAMCFCKMIIFILIFCCFQSNKQEVLREKKKQ